MCEEAFGHWPRLTGLHQSKPERWIGAVRSATPRMIFPPTDWWPKKMRLPARAALAPSDNSTRVRTGLRTSFTGPPHALANANAVPTTRSRFT